jgi:uncharacterized membrane protein
VRNFLTFSTLLEMIAITLWVGGMAALGFIAAPAIFQTAESRDSAGRSVGLILKRFQWVAYSCGAAILLAGAIRWSASWRGLSATEVMRYAVAALMLGLTLYSGLVVSRKLERLRAEMSGEIDSIPKSDPRRIAFNKLHGVSMTLMIFNVLLGLALAVLFALEG